MTLCKICCIPMDRIMSFSKDKHEKFCKCPICRRETKHVQIMDSELNFGEVLHRTMRK